MTFSMYQLEKISTRTFEVNDRRNISDTKVVER